MSFWQSVLGNEIHHFEQAYPGSKDCTSEEMHRAVQDWFSLYFDREVTEQEDPCQRLPYTIVNKLVRACFSEYTAEAKDETVFVQQILEQLDAVRRQALQLTLIGGEAWLKPVPDGKNFYFTVMRRDRVAVLGRNVRGEPNALGSAEVLFRDGSFYTLLEKRGTDTNGRLMIENRLFCSRDGQSIGSPVPLATLPEYAQLKERAVLEGVGSLGLVYLRMPVENCVDGSPDGVSVYAAAAGLIHNINRNERQLSREFENGESRVFASADLLTRRKNGERQLPAGLFVGLDDDPETTGLTIFAPELRQESFLARKREYLRNVESLIGLKRGILGEVEAAQRTATEVTSSEGDYSLTIQELQQMWEHAVRQAVMLCGQLGVLCRLPDARKALDADAVCLQWGNGVLHDREKEWVQAMELVNAGMLKPEIALAWRYEMPWQSQAALEEVRKRYMPERAFCKDGKEKD